MLHPGYNGTPPVFHPSMAQKPVGAKPVAKQPGAKPSAPAGKPARERAVWRTVIIASIVLLAGFVAAWIYMQRLDKLRKQTAYSKPIEVAAAVGNQTMRLTFAVRVTGADADWIGSNGAAIESVMKEAMTTAQPRTLATPDGMKRFEERVRSSANTKLGTDKVREVVITDFLYTTLD
jgi:hypothetical protein